ncbi:MAG: hypothetical protein E7254_07050 [Lachnospiraceae bacterium]|nr:hypothetical protein [Lachnospiraceae bacterium]
MRKQKVLSVVLSMALCASLCNFGLVSTSKAINGGTKSVSVKKSVFDEIKKSDIPQGELTDIAELALVNGKKTAEVVNAYTDTVDYETALNYALTSYYKTENFDEMEAFESELDERADKIVKGYEDAAEERKAGDKLNYEPGVVVAMFDDDTAKKEIEAVCDSGFGEIEEIYKDFEGKYIATISISLGQTVKAASDFYNEFSITETADMNAVRTNAFKKAEDVIYDANANYQYYLDTIHSVEAWDYMYTHNHSRVLTAVIDSGINLTNTDMINRISPLSAQVTDGNTILLTDLTEPTYATNHGSYVASTIGAETNSYGIAGVASAYDNSVCDLLIVQTANRADGKYYMNDIIRAVNYSVSCGAKVINESFGGAGYTETEDNFYTSVVNSGAIVIVSAGNDGISTSFYPADYPATISVVATDRYNVTTSFTNYGGLKDICAPGDGIYCYDAYNNIVSVNGTSLSAPIVAGVVSMMCSLDSSLTSNQVKSIMQSTAMPLAQGSVYVPAGVIDAYECVKAVGGTEKTNLEPISTKNQEETTTQQPEGVIEVSNLTTIGGWNNFVAIWNIDSIQLAQGYTFNVYVNGVLKAQNNTTGSFSMSNISAGGYVVTVKAVYNGHESTGVSKYVNVRGETVITTAAENYVTANPGWNTLSYWDIYLAQGWGNNPTGRYISGTNLGSFKFKLDTASGADWAVQLRTHELQFLAGTQYRCKVTVNSNMVANNIRFKEDRTGAENFYNFIQGENEIALNFTAGANGQFYFDLGQAPAGLEFTIISFQVEDLTQVTTAPETTTEEATTPETTTEEVTTVEETTTQSSSEYVNAIGGWNDAVSMDVYQAQGWGNDPLVSYKASPTINSFGLRIDKASGADWAIQTRTKELPQDTQAEYICTFIVNSNMAMSNLRFKEDRSGAETFVNLVPGENVLTLEHVSTGTAQYFFDFGQAPQGLQFEVTDFTAQRKNPLPSETNLAIGKTVTVSSTEDGNTLGQYAVDGDPSTRWSSQWMDNQWIMVDLGDVYSLSAVGIAWEAAYSNDYTIYTSFDGVNWGATNHETLTQACTWYTRATVHARYVKVQFNQRATQYGVSMYELIVMGRPLVNP